jgi:hypothetical protein
VVPISPRWLSPGSAYSILPFVATALDVGLPTLIPVVDHACSLCKYASAMFHKIENNYCVKRLG